MLRVVSLVVMQQCGILHHEGCVFAHVNVRVIAAEMEFTAVDFKQAGALNDQMPGQVQ
jgi:hypothetical protein